MTYLVDANVLSEPTKLAPSPKVDWLSSNEGNFVVDSVVLGELCIGALLLPAGRKRTQLQQWLDAVVQAIGCLPWDAAVSRRWAKPGAAATVERTQRTSSGADLTGPPSHIPTRAGSPPRRPRSLPS